MIIKTAFWAISQTLVKLISGFIIIKFISKVGGPDALSNFGLYQNLTTVLLMISGGLVFAGVTSKIARIEDESEFTSFYREATSFLNKLLLFTIIIIFPVCAWVVYHSSGSNGTNVIILLLVSLPFILMQTRFNFYLAILNGLNKVNLLARNNISASIITIILACTAYLLTSDWRYFAFCMCLGPALKYIFNNIRKEFPSSEGIHPDRNIRYLLRYSLVGIVSSLCLPTAQIIARDYITSRNGLFESGIWQGLTRFSEVYLVLVSSVLSIYLIPKISPVKTREKIRQCILPLLLLLVPFIIIGVSIIYALKEYIVVILFSHEFLPMKDLFVYQLPGDICKIFAWVLTFSLLGLGKTKTLIFLEIVYFFVYLILIYFFVPIYGLKGAVAAYSASYLLYFFLAVLVFFYWYKKYE